MTAHHFDAKSGKTTQPLASELTESAQPHQDEAAIRSAIRKVNAARPAADEQVKVCAWQIEDPKQTCYLSFDEIGVKHQKEHRAGNAEKRGKYVWNTVADIETNQGSHTVTGVGMKKTFLFKLSYLLQHKLLTGKSLVFFTDGAKDIFANIDEMFSLHPYTFILDWYHLKKRCQECLSMSVNGMSWSLSGSGALAQMKNLVMNDELHSWLYGIVSTAQNAMAS